MKESTTPSAQCHAAMQAESSCAYQTSTWADGSAEYRQRGRALKMKRWAAEGRKDAASMRDKAAAMAYKHKAVLDRIRLEQELEKRRCHLCDLVRAQAWGLGHRNWAARRCGRCWAQHAKLLSDEQLFQHTQPRAKSDNGSLQLPRQGIEVLASNTHPSNTQRLPGVLLDYLGLHQPIAPGIGACLHSGLQHLGQHQHRSMRLAQKHESKEAATANPLGSPAAVYNADVQGCFDSSQCSATQLKIENASPSCSGDEVNSSSSNGGTQPKHSVKHIPEAYNGVEGHSNTNTSQNLETLLGSFDHRLLLQCIMHIKSSPDSSPATHTSNTSFPMSQHAKHSLARLTARQAHKDLRASEAAWLVAETGFAPCPHKQGMKDTSDASCKNLQMQGASDGRSQQQQQQQQAAAFSTSCAATLTADRSDIATIPSIRHSAVADACTDAIRHQQPGSGMQQHLQGQPNGMQQCMQARSDKQTVGSGSSDAQRRYKIPQKKRDWMIDYKVQHEEALQREGSLLLQLEKWEDEMVFANTQAERTAALFQAVQLREELAVLGRANRRYRKAIQTRKNLMRGPVYHAVSPDGDRHVLGRGVPIETASGPVTRKHKTRKALPWTVAAVNRKLEEQMQQELTPQVTACVFPGRHGSIMAEQHTDADKAPGHHPISNKMPRHDIKDRLDDQQVGCTNEAGRRSEQRKAAPWHERLSYSTKVQHQTRQKRVLSLEQQSAVQAVLHEYRELRDLRPPVEPVGMHAQMRARAHDQQIVPQDNAVIDDDDPFQFVHGLDEMNGMKSSKLVTAIKQLVRDTHPAHPDERLMADQVTWRPSAMHSKPPVHIAGLCSVGDWDGLNPMHELAKLRSMPVDDFKSQLRKKREWGAAVKQLQLSLGMES